MNTVILVAFCIFSTFITLSNAICKSYQSPSGASAGFIQQHQDFPVDGTYCINLAIRIRADNDKYNEYYTQDYEAVAKSFLLHLNGTVQNQINIDCANKPNVATGNNAVAYSYNCCKDSKDNGVVCDSPKLIDPSGNAAFTHVISYTSLILSVLAYYSTM